MMKSESLLLKVFANAAADIFEREEGLNVFRVFMRKEGGKLEKEIDILDGDHFEMSGDFFEIKDVFSEKEEVIRQDFFIKDQKISNTFEKDDEETEKFKLDILEELNEVLDVTGYMWVKNPNEEIQAIYYRTERGFEVVIASSEIS